MTNQEIFDVLEALNDIKKSKAVFNVNTSYKLSTIKKILKPYYESIIDTRKEKFIQHGDFDEQGNIVVAKDEVKDLEQEIIDLFNIENDIKINKIKLQDLNDCNLPFDIIDKLIPIIEE